MTLTIALIAVLAIVIAAGVYAYRAAAELRRAAAGSPAWCVPRRGAVLERAVAEGPERARQSPPRRRVDGAAKGLPAGTGFSVRSAEDRV